MKGRGAVDNPVNRFERIAYVPAENEETLQERPATLLLRDTSRSILAGNDSPDVGFDVSLNPYRGCEHGCIYCYARPTHEYLGFSAGLDFETRILAKQDAPELLRKELMSRRWKPRTIAISGVTDPYQPAERSLRLTRRCLEVLLDFRNPVGIITKNFMVTRDLDLLVELSRHNAACVSLSVTTLDAPLQRLMEPRASTPVKRLEAIRRLSRAGVPVRVMVAPVVPGLTDHELPSILQAAAEAGAQGAGYVMLRLPHGVKHLFEEWLGRHFPERRQKVLNRILEVRGGEMYNAQFHTRMRGQGVYADQIKLLFETSRRKAGLDGGVPPLSAASFRRPGKGVQPGLFG